MRPELHLLTGDGERTVVVVREDHLLDLAAALRVDALAHDGGAGLLAQVNRAHGACNPRRIGHRGVLVRRHILKRRDDGADVIGRTAAAPAHHVGAEVAHHGGDLPGHLVGAQVVMRHATHIARQAGVRHHRNGLGGMRAHVAHGLAQVLRTHGAVGADDIHAHALEDGDHRTHVGAQQHAAGLVQRHLSLDGHRGAHVLECQSDAVDGRAGLEDVLLGLDEQHVGAALHQTLGLGADLVGQLVEGNARQLRVIRARQHSRGPDRPDDKSRNAVGGLVVVACAPGDRRGGHVDVGHELGEVAPVGALPFGKAHRGGLERVGLHGLGPCLEVRAVDLLEHIGSRDRQVVHGTLERTAAVVIGGEVACLDLGAEAAVEDDDAVAQGR